MPTPVLDTLDHQLIDLLSRDARVSNRKIAADLGVTEGTVRGHTFHHGAFDSPLPPAGQTRAQRHHGRAESLWRIGRLHASFLHLYFPSNPLAIAALFNPEH